MRILLTAASCSPHYGGPAFLLTRLAQALVARGIEISVWAADGSAATTPLLPVSSAVRRIGGSLNDALGTPKSFDVVHDHGIWLPHNHRLARLCSQYRLPRVVSIHGMLDPWCINHKALKKRVAWHLYQKTDLKAAQYYHVTSAEELRNIEKWDLGVPAKIIPLGVDVSEVPPRTSTRGEGGAAKIAAYLGRLHPVKGLPMLIEAWNNVRPDSWLLKIAGPDEGSHRKDLEELVASYELSNVISFSGALHGSEKQAFLLNADLFILPSFSESFGLAVAEALSFQVPVLTTTSAPWGVLETERCGWSVEPKVGGLALGLRRATLQSSTTLAAMGARGRDWVEANLGWETVTDQYIRLYQKTLLERRSI